MDGPVEYFGTDLCESRQPAEIRRYGIAQAKRAAREFRRMYRPAAATYLHVARVGRNLQNVGLGSLDVE